MLDAEIDCVPLLQEFNISTRFRYLKDFPRLGCRICEKKREKRKRIKLEQFDLTSRLSDTANEIIKHFDLDRFNDLERNTKRGNTQSDAFSFI